MRFSRMKASFFKDIEMGYDVIPDAHGRSVTGDNYLIYAALPGTKENGFERSEPKLIGRAWNVTKNRHTWIGEPIDYKNCKVKSNTLANVADMLLMFALLRFGYTWKWLEQYVETDDLIGEALGWSDDD